MNSIDNAHHYRLEEGFSKSNKLRPKPPKIRIEDGFGESKKICPTLPIPPREPTGKTTKERNNG